MSSILPDLSSDMAAKLWADSFVPELSKLIHSQSNAEKLGGLLAIGEAYFTQSTPYHQGSRYVALLISESLVA